MGSPHVAARLHGHGKVVLPLPGYRVERADGDLVLRIARGDRSGVIDVRGAGAPELCAIDRGQREGSWRIETSDYACAWPEGFAIVPDATSMSAFLLVGPDESMIWVNGPMEARRATPIETLADEGQRVRAIAESPEGSARIDLDYQEDGALFWQRRYVVRFGGERVVIVSAQAPARHEDLVGMAVDLVERTLERI